MFDFWRHGKYLKITVDGIGYHFPHLNPSAEFINELKRKKGKPCRVQTIRGEACFLHFADISISIH